MSPKSPWGSDAALFTPHAFTPQVDYRGTSPQVCFTWDVYNFLRMLVSHTTGPISIVGIAEKMADDACIVSRVWLPPQEAHGNTSTITPDDWAKLAEEIMAANPEDGTELFNRINFYGRTSDTLVAVAGDEEKAARTYFSANNNQPWCLLGIFSRQGRIDLTLHRFAGLAMSFRDVPWAIAEPADAEALLAAVTAEMNAKVRWSGYRRHAATEFVAEEEIVFVQTASAGSPAFSIEEEGDTAPTAPVELPVPVDWPTFAGGGKNIGQVIEAKTTEELHQKFLGKPSKTET